jgi:hypothetical protein
MKRKFFSAVAGLFCLAASAGSEGAAPAVAGPSVLLPKSSLNGAVLVSGAGSAPRPALPSVAGGRLSFVAPTAVAARGHDLYVVDSGLGAVLRIDTLQETATVLANLPNRMGVRLHVMADSSLLVLDPGSRRVLHYSRDGALINTYRDDINLVRPVAMTVDQSRGLILVADSMQNFIVAFHLSGSAASIIVPKVPDGDRSMSISAMAMAPDGLYVLDRVAREILHLTRDGGIIETFGSDVLQTPTAIAADSHGRLVVADSHGTKLKVFAGGDLVEEVSDSGLSLGPWRDIADIYADDMGGLYVAERGAGRIDVLRFGRPNAQ